MFLKLAPTVDMFGSLAVLPTPDVAADLLVLLLLAYWYC